MKRRFVSICLLSIPTALLVAQSETGLPDGPGVDAPIAQTVVAQSAAVALYPQPAVSGSLAPLPDSPDFETDHTDELLVDAPEEAEPSSFPPGAATIYNRNPNLALSGKYHWSGLMWQSLGFLAVETTYRMATDDYMRHLIADGPYWHNYIASLEQWNMRRWNDGDSVLVDYIGHPMQGAVSGFIEVQNSPRQKYLRISGSREYWRSRFYAMMWATVFSTQQKIGPLGEAALGSAGGYTYPLHCPYPCKSYTEGVTKYTNNTGWTDFITTPVIGTLWTVMEDFIDREVSDRLEDRYGFRLAPKIIRGALNPTRTAANAMRGKNPWYRDYRHYEADALKQARLPSESANSRGETVDEWFRYRFEVFPHLDVISLPVNTATCSHCRQMLYGPGTGFSAGLTRHLDFDADLSSHSDASPLPSDRAGGSILIGSFGFRSGMVWKRFAARAAIRPGFATYDKAFMTSPKKNQPTPEVGRITHFMTALALSGDARITPRLGFRFVLANDPVRYREPRETPPGNGKPPYLNWLSHKSFLTNENWSYQTGMVFRF